MKKTDARRQMIEVSVRTDGKRPDTICLLSSVFCLLMLSSCASTPKLPPPPPKYVYAVPKASEAPPVVAGGNSLWRDTASLYEDARARRLNDLITINVVENISGSGTADTKAGRNSSSAAGIDNFFGVPTNFNLPNVWGNGNGFSPKVGGSLKDSFAGTGATNRAGKLVGTITAKVVEVMPNGTLSLESRKEITINNEKQVLVLRGMVRPDDIANDNSILSSRVADAEVFYVGDGIVQRKQDEGWLTKILDTVWPF